MQRQLLKISILVAVVIIVGSVGFRIFNTWSDDAGQTAKIPTQGALGSTHGHMSILIFLNDTRLDLSGDQYMDRIEEIHLHDNNGIVIHKHVKGATLPQFLGSLGITLSEKCLIVDDTPYCTDGKRHLQVLVNKVPANEWIDEYELTDADKILITYGGDESAIATALKYNSIPDLPKDLSYDTFNKSE